MARGGVLAATVRAKALLAESRFLSTTCTVKAKALAVVGVPETVPFEAFNERPAGNAPVTTDQVYGETPPVAARV